MLPPSGADRPASPAALPPPPAQELLNEEYQDTQIFSNEDIAHIVVGVLMEELVQVVSVPNGSSAPTASDASGVDAMRPHDVKLFNVAQTLGSAVVNERNLRILGFRAHARPEPDENAAQEDVPQEDAAKEQMPRRDVSKVDLVKIGGDLLFFSQEFELNVPGAPAFVPPSSPAGSDETLTRLPDARPCSQSRSPVDKGRCGRVAEAEEALEEGGHEVRPADAGTAIVRAVRRPSARVVARRRPAQVRPPRRADARPAGTCHEDGLRPVLLAPAQCVPLPFTVSHGRISC